MELVPKPTSKFVRVKCPECEHEMIVFNHSKTKVECNGEDCNHLLVEPLGGKAFIDAEIIEELDL